ncbi:MAG TPA: ubiquinol-cytochrome c reductase iron-sulfur subunit [Anaerolineales bacterium]|nr:ubiquinol-cytochrome c reductase iron-sulfur subunit [Anaerolineales bacterium]
MAGSHNINRRDFVKLTTAAVGTIIGVSIGIPAVGYLISPALVTSNSKDLWLPVGVLADIPLGKPFPFSFTITQVNGWERTANSYGGFVIRKSDADDDLTILSSRCTHLGCQVNWKEESNAFVCPCHDASFDREGNVISGPPPRPLDIYTDFKVDDEGKLLIHIQES